MGKYLTILTAIIILGVIAIFGKDFFFPQGTGTLSVEEEQRSLAEDNRVAVTHAFKDGFHRYNGTFLLPHSCFSVKQSGFYEDGMMTVEFQVEDRLLLETTCSKITTRYPFTILLEAPEEVPVTFFLNGEAVPSKIRNLEWQSAAGTLIDTSVTSPTLR